MHLLNGVTRLRLLQALLVWLQNVMLDLRGADLRGPSGLRAKSQFLPVISPL